MSHVEFSEWLLLSRTVTRYQVAVTTGDELRADTDAAVYCTLVGQYGDTGKRLLLKAKNNQGPTFRRGQVLTA